MHTNDAGKRVALLRAYDKRTGEDVGAVEMPSKQTGSPMTYMINGKQFIVLAVSGSDGARDPRAPAVEARLCRLSTGSLVLPAIHTRKRSIPMKDTEVGNEITAARLPPDPARAAERHQPA